MGWLRLRDLEATGRCVLDMDARVVVIEEGLFEQVPAWDRPDPVSVPFWVAWRTTSPGGSPSLRWFEPGRRQGVRRRVDAEVLIVERSSS